MKFCLCTWFPENGVGSIHPDDLNRFRLLQPYGKIFVLEGPDGDYVSVRYGNSNFRVRSDMVRSVDFSPDVSVGDVVRVLDSGESGRIYDVYWHHKNAEPMLFLEIKEKRKSRRYTLSEIERLS